MEERLDSRKLRYFVEAIEQGSFNRAAGNLRVSQPALSKAIRLLELDLDQRVLNPKRPMPISRNGASENAGEGNTSANTRAGQP
jgi:DNA-binding transcriptional LysR family regulator